MNRFIKNRYVPPIVGSSRRSRARSIGGWGTMLLSCVSLALVIILSSCYLFEINSMFSSGYELKDLEQTRSELEQGQRKLRLEATELQSLASIRSRVYEIGMERIISAEYLTVAEESIAYR